MKGNIYIGTSGWSYKHWMNIFYPPGLKSTEWLTYYTGFFDITEINTSFYHLPKPATITGWINKVPPDFKFCPKISRYLTHIKRLAEPEESLGRFFELFEQMHQLMGPVLVQLPPSFSFNYDRAEYFFKLLKKEYKNYSFVMEVRHPSWVHDDSLTLMARYDIGLVISQSGVRFPYSEMVTAKNVYVRFHGPADLYASAYNDDALQMFADKFQSWSAEGHDVWAFFNNDIHGYALNDAMKLMALCGLTKRAAI